LDIKEYSYVLAIVDNGNISRAAQALYISQPSLSIFLKNLENRLGTTLFERKDGKMILTYEGERYVDYARKIIALSGDLESELDEIKENKMGRIRIGVMLSRGTRTLPSLLKGLKELHPQIEVLITEGTQTELEDMITRGDIDIALINYPFKGANLSYETLSEYGIVLAAPKDMGLSELAEYKAGFPYPFLDLRKLDEKTPFVLLKQGRACRRFADNVFEKLGVYPRKVLFETGLITTAYASVREGLAIAFVYDTQFDAQRDGNVEIFSVAEDMTRKYVVAYSEDRAHDSLVQLIVESCVKILADVTWTQD